MRPGPKRSVPKIDATPTQWAYLAGFLDGEGCIGTHKAPNGRRRPNLSVKQKFPAPLEYLAETFGGSVSIRKHPKPGTAMCSWRITSGLAEAVLRGAEPYLVLKRDQAQLALKMFYEYDLKKSDKMAARLSAMKKINPKRTRRGSTNRP